MRTRSRGFTEIEPHLAEHSLSELLVDIVGAGASVEMLTEHFEVIELDPETISCTATNVVARCSSSNPRMLTMYADEEDITVRLRRATTGALLGVAAFFRRHEPETLTSIRAAPGCGSIVCRGPRSMISQLNVRTSRWRFSRATLKSPPDAMRRYLSSVSVRSNNAKLAAQRSASNLW